MADAICRWRNGTPKTVVELVNSLPHEKMPIDVFRNSMSNKWNGDFFRTAYQLACQLALYCESEDGYYYPRFDHDINEQEAEEYLFFWLPRYYIPNPYTRKDGFQKITCPTYFLKELYEYTLKNSNCTYKEAYEACFQETAKNNDDIIRNYINSYSRILSFSKEGILNTTAVNPKLVFDDMDRNNKKDFFDNFSNNNQRAFQVLHLPHQQIFYGAPGTGKSHTIKVATEACPKENVVRTTFHPDSDYSTFVGAYKPAMQELPRYNPQTGERMGEEKKIVYAYTPQAFLKAYVKAWQVPEEPVFLIIEEINRGNCAQIFGDLFQLLDREEGISEYPIKADQDMQQYLTEALSGCEGLDEKIRSGEELVLPPNLYIWATMNTSDQSLFPIDSAFKRRWEWKYVKIKNHPEENYQIKLSDTDKRDWWEFVKQVNRIIASMTSSADKQLGYFFCKADADKVISADKFVSKVLFYLWNDVFKDYGFEDASLFRYADTEEPTKTHELTFPDFYDEDGEKVNIDRVADFIDKVMAWDDNQKQG